MHPGAFDHNIVHERENWRNDKRPARAGSRSPQRIKKIVRCLGYDTEVFTGIIEATAEVLSWDGSSLALSRPPLFDDLKPGSSISVQGVCLSITKLDTGSMHFYVVPETIDLSTLGSLTKGQRVNLERAMKTGGRLDGHIVQGHIEGVGTVRVVGEELEIELPSALVSSIQSKGSIAIDGVSLTVASLEGNVIRIALIPLTRSETTLGRLQKGDRVNIETDILARAGHATLPPL